MRRESPDGPRSPLVRLAILMACVLTALVALLAIKVWGAVAEDTSSTASLSYPVIIGLAVLATAAIWFGVLIVSMVSVGRKVFGRRAMDWTERDPWETDRRAVVRGSEDAPPGWRLVTEEESAALTAELERECPRGHVLRGRSVRAHARCERCDGVLLELEGSEWATVHLTWHVETDPRWPSVGSIGPLRGVLADIAAGHRH